MYGWGRERFLNRNGWGIAAVDSMERNIEEEINTRKWEVQRQVEGNKIEEARYMSVGRIPENLGIEKLRSVENGMGVRALIRVRCSNMEEDNKYWLEEEARKCILYN